MLLIADEYGTVRLCTSPCLWLQYTLKVTHPPPKSHRPQCSKHHADAHTVLYSVYLPPVFGAFSLYMTILDWCSIKNYQWHLVGFGRAASTRPLFSLTRKTLRCSALQRKSAKNPTLGNVCESVSASFVTCNCRWLCKSFLRFLRYKQTDRQTEK